MMIIPFLCTAAIFALHVAADLCKNEDRNTACACTVAEHTYNLSFAVGKTVCKSLLDDVHVVLLYNNYNHYGPLLLVLIFIIVLLTVFMTRGTCSVALVIVTVTYDGIVIIIY